MNRLFAKGLRTCSLVACGTVFSSLVAPAVLANELPNGGFESGATWNTTTNHQIVSSNARSGSSALQITSTGTTHTTFSNKINANQGEEFVFDTYVKAQNLVAEPNGAGDTPIALVRFRDGNGYVTNAHGKRTEGYRWAPYVGGVGTYPYTNNKMQIRFQMTQTGDAFDIGLRSWKHNKSGKTWWDDMSVTKLSFPDRGALLATHQAEDANSITKGFIDNDEKEFTGTGYVDVTANKAALTFNNVQGGGERVISVRYSWEGFIRNIDLKVNGSLVESKPALATGRRGMYATLDFVTTLPAGGNTIQLIVGKGGGALGQPLIDKFDVYQKSGGGGGPQPPAAPGNLQASDFSFTDKVAVTWNSAATATSYDVYRDTSTAGPGTLIGSATSTSLDDTTAIAGTTYQYRVQGCNTAGCGAFSAWDAGTRNTTGGGGDGALSVVAATATANTSISEDASDFLKLGATEVRMANVVAQIFGVTGLGDTSGLPYTASLYGHQWQNGTPTLSGSNVKSGLRVFNNNKGLSFTAAAGLQSRNLRIWITGKGKGSEALSATLTASLSDGSAADVSTTINQSGTAKTGRLITLTYSAAAEGQLLTVNVLKNGGAFIGLDAVSMIGGTGEPPNEPPSFESVSEQTITEGDDLFIDLEATDPEGMAITLSKTDDLPGAAAVLTDFGSGMGTIEWSSAVGDVGSYTIVATAEDADSQSSTIDIDVNVLPIGGATGSLAAIATRVTDRNLTLAGSYIKYAPTAAIDEAFNSNGAQPFSAIERLGGALGARTSNSHVRYTYSGATPQNGTRVRGGNRIFDPAPVGLSMTVDADASPNSATVYVGVKDVVGRAIISLSDSSAAPVIVDIDRKGLSLATYAIDIDFQAGSAGQTVEVQLLIQEETSNGIVGWVQFEAAQQ